MSITGRLFRSSVFGPIGLLGPTEASQRAKAQKKLLEEQNRHLSRMAAVPSVRANRLRPARPLRGLAGTTPSPRRRSAIASRWSTMRSACPPARRARRRVHQVRRGRSRLGRRSQDADGSLESQSRGQGLAGPAATPGGGQAIAMQLPAPPERVADFGGFASTWS